MDDQLDNDLKNRIREAFENLEDTSADEGWLQLREKFPAEEPNRRVFAWKWFGAAAALLLVSFGISLWISNDKVQPKKFTYNNVKHIKSESEKYVEKPLRDTPETTAGNGYNTAKTNVKKTNLNPKNKNVITHTPGSNAGLSPEIKNHLAKTNGDSGNSNSGKSIFYKHRRYTKPGAILQKALSKTLATETKPLQTPDSDKVDNLHMQQFQVAVKPNIEPAKPAAAVVEPPAKSINSMFAEDKYAETKKRPEKNDKKVHFGVYAATYFNYAKGSNNQINVGAGFTSDIKISRNLKLVTGVTIAQNSLNYNNGGPVSGDNPVIIASQNNNPVSNAHGAAANYFGVSSVSGGVSSVATVKNYNASLVGLDVPLNLKYEFNPQKSDIYIIAGLSSGTFINETYTYQYNSQTYFSPSTQQTQGETTNKSFNSFYFAKMLNVAFGAGFPFGKNRLVIEPFLKYPIGGLGSQDIRFGQGGLNLKFNFRTSKK